MQVADKVNSSSWGKVTKQINTQILALHFELADTVQSTFYHVRAVVWLAIESDRQKK